MRNSFLLFEDNAYGFSPKLEFWVDVEEFDGHWQEGRRLEKSGEQEAAWREYEAAEALYQGDFLENDPYEEWTLLRREGLKDTQLTILAKLAQRSIEIGDYIGAIARCQKILEDDACREDAYQWLTRCHVRLGHPGRAHRWYQTCVRVLHEELDLAPGEETLRLYHELVSGVDPFLTGN